MHGSLPLELEYQIRAKRPSRRGEKRERILLVALAVWILLSNHSVALCNEKVWPDPPDTARIRYETSIYNSADIGVTRSIFSKIIDFVTSRDVQDGILLRPQGMFVDEHGKIYVTDQGAKCLHIFDPGLQKYVRIDHAQDTHFRSPVDVAVSSDKKIFITDSQLRKVFVFDEKGKYLFVIKGYFERPTGIDIFSDIVIVTDTGSHKVMSFSTDGILLSEHGSRGANDGYFNYPTHISSNENIYITDAVNFRIQVFDSDFHHISTIGEQGDVQGSFSRPKGVAIDSDHNIYVTDGLMDVIQIFNKSGQLLLVVGGSGAESGSFNMPGDIHIDQNNRIYVADTLNGRIQIFQYLEY